MEFKSICRACLASKDDLYDMFLNATSEMYSFCTSIQVSENNVLPKHLCHFCYELLNKFYNFKQKCIQSNERLHQYIESHEDVKPPLAVDCDVKLDLFDKLLVSTSKSNENNQNDTIKKNELFEEEQSIGRGKELNIRNEDIHNNEECSPPDDNSDTFEVVYKKVKRKKKVSSKSRKLRVKKKKNYKELEDDHKNSVGYSCTQCSKKFSYPERLEAHRLTHEGAENDISCRLCNKKFKQWDGLRRHREFVHMTVGKSLKCPTCGKLYKTEMTLKNHLKIHQERKSFVCHICGGSFRSAGGLQNHVETHKENREKSYECKICNKKFVSNNYLTSHMFRHKERRFVCTVCRFPFFTRADLNRHLLIHSGVKPFVCEICSKAYSTKSFLIEHGRIHSGERPFACDYCAMNFISKRRLIDHQRTHTGEKPHKCDKCNQAFIQRGSLTRHLRVHARRKYADTVTAPLEQSPEQFPAAPLSPKKFETKLSEEESMFRMALSESKIRNF